MSRARELSKLVNPSVFSVDTSNNIGVNSTSPDAKLDVAGIVSATAFYGDGSNLEGVASAGLGTALGEEGGLEVIYYTDNILTVGSTITVDPPSTTNVAYTQYSEIAVSGDADLIVADGDDLVPDILGLSTEGVSPIVGSGGRVRADNFTSHSGNGAPTFPNGVNVTGVVTATSFDGAVNLSATELSDTVQTSTTSSSSTTITGSGTNTVTDLADNGTGTYPYYLTIDDVNNGDSIHTQLSALSPGDTFTVRFTAGDETYTFQSFSLSGGFPFNYVTVQYTVNSGTNKSEASIDLVFPGPTLRVITGSNDPIWDTSLPTVAIGGTDYNTSDWTVSGVTATHKTSNPTINVSDAIAQSSNVVSIGVTTDTKSSMTISGKDASLVVTDGTNSCTITPSSAVMSKGSITPTFASINGGTVENSYYLYDGNTFEVFILVDLPNGSSITFAGIDLNTGNSRSVITLNSGLPGGPVVALGAGTMLEYNDNNGSTSPMPNISSQTTYSNCYLGWNPNNSTWYVVVPPTDVSVTGDSRLIINAKALIA